MTQSNQPTSPTLAADDNLQRLLDALVTILKHANVSEDQVIEGVRRSYATVEVPATSQEYDPTLSSAHKVVLGQMVSIWRGDSRFVDDMGNPKLLTRTGTDASMLALYEATEKTYPTLRDVLPPEEAIERLLAAGTIEERDGAYRLMMSYYRMKSDRASGSLGHVSYLLDFARVSAKNIMAKKGEGTFQRVVVVHHVPASMVPVIQGQLEDQGMTFLEDIDHKLEFSKLKQPSDAADTVRIAVGTYFSVDDDKDINR